MRRILRGRSALAIVAGLIIAPACTDRMPTFADADRLPTALEPVTIEFTLQSGDFLTDVFVVRGTTDVTDSDDLVVALDFDGLDAHVLAEFSSFPDTIVFTGSEERGFSYVGGEVRSAISDSLAASASTLTFYLWEVAEEWDATVTWTEAVGAPESRPWQEPGGTRGELLSAVTWTRADTTAAGDSLVWALSPEILEMVSENPSPSFMVTMEEEAARAEITPLSVRLMVTPEGNPDTVLTRVVAPVRQTFIYSREEPAPADLLRVGGLTSDRSLLRMQLPDVLPGCLDGACPPVATSEVTLNRVDLVLDPEPVTLGFRPVAPITIIARRLFEPELGPQAPLGDVISATDTITAGRFISGGGAPVTLVVTRIVGQALAAREAEIRSCQERLGSAGCQALEDKEIEIGVALLVEPEASTFWFAWFDRTPRLRFIYTLRQTPGLP
jgi:hypothetical protein